MLGGASDVSGSCLQHIRRCSPCLDNDKMWQTSRCTFVDVWLLETERHKTRTTNGSRGRLPLFGTLSLEERNCMRSMSVLRVATLLTRREPASLYHPSFTSSTQARKRRTSEKSAIEHVRRHDAFLEPRHFRVEFHRLPCRFFLPDKPFNRAHYEVDSQNFAFERERHQCGAFNFTSHAQTSLSYNFG